MSFSVEATGLTMRFGRFTAVDNVSFSVQAGEIFGFLGANGAGKTTTIRILCGLLIPSDGTARVAGHNLRLDPNAVKGAVGYMSQRFTLYNDLSVAENLSFTAALRKVEPERISERVRDLLAQTGFGPSPEILVRDLPPGVKQQVALANAMLHEPKVVFLDEPTAGVTPASRQTFWRLIRRIADSGKTVFLTTHYMDEAEQCDRVALMRAGKIIALDSPERLKRETFPAGIIEIEPAPEAPKGWKERFFGSEAVGELEPHGMRWHLTVRDEAAWEALAARMPESLKTKRIPPSLEDVFMELVEGEER